MPPQLQVLWTGELLFFVIALVTIAIPVHRIQLDGRLRMGTTTIAIVGYLLCVGLSGAHFWGWQFSEQHSKAMRARTGSAVLPEGWGSNFTNENRTKYSSTMARHAFTNWGEIAIYLDLNGKRQPYEPTKEDHAQRVAYLAYLETIDVAKSSFLAYALIWPFVPLIALWFGLSHLTQPLMRVLTRRSRTDRPQSAGPLS